MPGTSSISRIVHLLTGLALLFCAYLVIIQAADPAIVLVAATAITGTSIVGLLHHKWMQPAYTGGTLIVLFTGQWLLYRNALDTSGGYILLVIGLAVFFTINSFALLSSAAMDTAVQSGIPRVRPFWLVVSFGLILLTTYRTLQSPPEAQFGEYLMTWGGSLLALTLAARQGQKSPIGAERSIRRWEYALLVVLFASALMIRGINLGTEPRVMDDNEAIFTNWAIGIRTDQFITSPFWPGYHSYPLLYPGLIAYSFNLFGQSVAAARILSALAGALAIPAIYLLGRELLDPLFGIAAALFTMSWAYHIQFSRLALNQPFDPLFGALAFYFLLRTFRRSGAVDAMLCGIMLGIAQLFYLGGRLDPVVMVAYVAYLWLRDRSLISKQWRLIALVVLGFVVTTLPQNAFTLLTHQPFSEHADVNIIAGGGLQSAVTKGQLLSYLGDQLSLSVGGLFSTRDTASWYGQSSNLMGPLGGPLLLLGSIACLAKLRKRPQLILPLGWVLGTVLIGSALSTDPPQYQRYFPGVPALALLCGMGIVTIAATARDLIPNSDKYFVFTSPPTPFSASREGERLTEGSTVYLAGSGVKRPKLLVGASIGISVVCFAANLAFYTGTYIPEGKYLYMQVDTSNDALARQMAAAYDNGYPIVLFGDYQTHVRASNVVGFFMSGKRYDYYSGPPSKFLSKAAVSAPAMLFIAPTYRDDLDTLRRQLPGGTLQSVYADAEQRDLEFYTYEVKR